MSDQKSSGGGFPRRTPRASRGWAGAGPLLPRQQEPPHLRQHPLGRLDENGVFQPVQYDQFRPRQCRIAATTPLTLSSAVRNAAVDHRPGDNTRSG